jgi:hypothetical protein
MRKKVDKAAKGMDEVVRSLADLLLKAAPLVELVNSPTTSHEHRALLRELVGGERYALLSVSLRQMCSWRTWEIANAKDEAARQKLRRVGLTGASFDGTAVTLHGHRESAGD